MNSNDSNVETGPAGITYRLRSTAAGKIKQAIVVTILAIFSLASIATTAGIIMMLFLESSRFFGTHEIRVNREEVEKDFTIGEFLTTTKWNMGTAKFTDEVNYGVWPLLLGTLKITGVAMLIALPLGLVTAVYLSEYAPKAVRSFLKPTLEILAGIPTVVLGFFALLVITPLLQGLGEFSSLNPMAAGIAVGVLCIPLVTSLSEDALRAVPNSLREGAYGLGSTRFEVTWKVIVPAALSGIISAFLLALARAIGETMVVALAAGTQAKFNADMMDESQTMTGFIVQTFSSENVVPGTVNYYSLYVIAGTLFLLTLFITFIGQLIRMRYREVYQ